MRDNPIHSFFHVMTGQIHDQLALGGYAGLTVVAPGSGLAFVYGLAS